MKILLGFAITLTVFIQFLLAQPVPLSVADESANSTEYAINAYIFKAVKLLSNKLEPVIIKALPHIPKSPEYEGYRDQLKIFLQLKRDYTEAELNEDCGEKAIKLFDHQTVIVSHYVDDNSKSPAIQEITEILNEYGMQKVKDYVAEVDKVVETLGDVDQPDINKYVIEHCKPSESN